MGDKQGVSRQFKGSLAAAKTLVTTGTFGNESKFAHRNTELSTVSNSQQRRNTAIPTTNRFSILVTNSRDRKSLANPISFGHEGANHTPRKSANFQKNSAITSSDNNQRKSGIQPGSSNVERHTFTATRVSTFGQDPNAKRSIFETSNRKSVLDHAHERSGRNSFIGMS